MVARSPFPLPLLTAIRVHEPTGGGAILWNVLKFLLAPTLNYPVPQFSKFTIHEVLTANEWQ